MIPVIRTGDALKQLFAALAEHTFEVDLGIADPPLIDYLSEMLVRFSRVDTLYRVRDARGKQLHELAAMLTEAQERQAKPRREIHRHIGDFALFWSGVYPEALSHLQSEDHQDHLLDYCEQGKRAYLIASSYREDPWHEEAAVLERLSAEFELCTVGLRRVRAEWERLPAERSDDTSSPSRN
jgi:hypothetical protein